LNTEAQESALLRAIVKQRLVKTKWEVLVRAIVNCKVCELAIALYFFVATICMSSIKQLPIQTPYVVAST
jgi:hypothetical protein